MNNWSPFTKKAYICQKCHKLIEDPSKLCVFRQINKNGYEYNRECLCPVCFQQCLESEFEEKGLYVFLPDLPQAPDKESQ